MNIPEYYLHMLAGWNGAHDETHFGSRPVLAAIMSHFKVKATTKTDIVRELALESTPGFLLGQRETTMGSYYVRNYANRALCSRLVTLKKVGRTFNYLLDWDVLEEEDVDLDFYSSNWIAIAQIYWWGRLLFGHNVIPETVITTLRRRIGVRPRNDAFNNAFNPFLVQFLRDIDIMPMEGHVRQAFEPGSMITGTPTYRDVMLSFVTSIAPYENAVGFYACMSLLPAILQRDQPVQNGWEWFKGNMKWWDSAQNYPIGQSYYVNGLANPSMERSLRPGNFPISVREIIPVIMGKKGLTPMEEQANRYMIPFAGIDITLADRNPFVYTLMCILYEYHLLLTNQPMFELSALKTIREASDWTMETLTAAADSMVYFGNKNYTVQRILGVNIERQNQV